ncbi:serine/threonine protein kinase [Persicimonas caeni]|uniref:Serine/threonine protein kinase n=1 Tax=Persicimonas caeni TaxID=2292766 RepID=A0A4Y6Q3X5_PERCE|nr:serine/threonine-protein kinase [Persicimonas caeni]QDG54685.1 serine/threonine protein kinase [Persicimonas caeni]QED35906.1 serine/threonine protein kinase [Persicimonas caeni]
MPICPHCETACESLLAPCPTGDGYYCVDDKEYAAYSDDALLGQRIADRFIVSSVLGRGSMGKVYKALQDQVDRDVALKVFRPETLVKRSLGRSGTAKEKEAARARFVQEAKVLGQLSHPNCVTVYDFGMGKDEDYLYMAMEFVGGVSLREAVNRGLKFEAIVEITRQILRALREAHSLGIVHRDLKPENIVLSYRFNTGEHVVKVLDFGIAKLLGADAESYTRAGALFGTPAYMSPEQCRGEVDTIGPQVDIYALGCILYEMICRQLPFMAQVPQQMVRLHQEAEIPPLNPRKGINVPDGVEEFIHKCLAKDRGDRYADADEALMAFEQILAKAGESGAGSLDSGGLGSMAKTIQKRSGTTHGARSVIVPKDNVSGDVLDPLRNAPFEPGPPEKSAADGPAPTFDAAIQATPPTNQVPKPHVSVPKSSSVRETAAGSSADGESSKSSMQAGKGGPSRQTILIGAALLAVLFCVVLVFFLIYNSIMAG